VGKQNQSTVIHTQQDRKETIENTHTGPVAAIWRTIVTQDIMASRHRTMDDGPSSRTPATIAFTACKEPHTKIVSAFSLWNDSWVISRRTWEANK
jgi:hypothetical protein